MDHPVPAVLYYQLGRIDPEYVKRYTVTEMNKMLLQTQHYGPWHDGPPNAYRETPR